jgi:hypothetical protein
MKFHGPNVVSLSIRLRGLPGRSFRRVMESGFSAIRRDRLRLLKQV